MKNTLEEWHYWEDTYCLTYRFGCCPWRLPSCLLWGLHSCPWRLSSCLAHGLWDFTPLDLPLDSDDSMSHTRISGTLGDFLVFPTFDLGFCFNCLTHCNIKIWLESIYLWQPYTGKGVGIWNTALVGQGRPEFFQQVSNRYVSQLIHFLVCM